MRICASSGLCRSCPTSRHRLCWSRRWWARSMRASCLLSSTRMACSPIGPATPHLASTFFVNTISAFFLLHTLHPLFFAPHALCKHVCYHVYVHIHAYFFLYILYIIFLYILFFCPRCAVQVCMLSCICTHTCIFLHIYIHIHSYIGPATRPRASTWPPTASSSLRFTHTHTHTHMRTRHGDVGIKVCMYMYVHCT